MYINTAILQIISEYTTILSLAKMYLLF